MFCTNCGAKLPEHSHSTYCPVCGAVITSIGADSSNTENRMTGNEVEEKVQKEEKENKFPDILIDPDEEQIAVLGSGYLDNLLHGGVLSEGFGILTDKRFYFKGKCYRKSSDRYESVNEEYSVDLEDITATGFTETRNFKLIILAAIVLALSLLVTAVACDVLFLQGGGLISFVLLFLYVCLCKIYYEISVAGASICVLVSTYGGIEKVKAFNKALRLEKDKHRKNVGN